MYFLWRCLIMRYAGSFIILLASISSLSCWNRNFFNTKRISLCSCALKVKSKRSLRTVFTLVLHANSTCMWIFFTKGMWMYFKPLWKMVFLSNIIFNTSWRPQHRKTCFKLSKTPLKLLCISNVFVCALVIIILLKSLLL